VVEVVLDWVGDDLAVVEVRVEPGGVAVS